jgi:hypothetical protein
LKILTEKYSFTREAHPQPKAFSFVKYVNFNMKNEEKKCFSKIFFVRVGSWDCWKIFILGSDLKHCRSLMPFIG